jgi:septal ring factor EnvC (AmiA/AmiB activator)
MQCQQPFLVTRRKRRDGVDAFAAFAKTGNAQRPMHFEATCPLERGKIALVREVSVAARPISAMARESNDPTAEILSALREEYGALVKELDYVKAYNDDLQQELEAQETALKEYQEKCTQYQQHLQNEAESWKVETVEVKE